MEPLYTRTRTSILEPLRTPCKAHRLPYSTQTKSRGPENCAASARESNRPPTLPSCSSRAPHLPHWHQEDPRHLGGRKLARHVNATHRVRCRAPTSRCPKSCHRPERGQVVHGDAKPPYLDPQTRAPCPAAKQLLAFTARKESFED